MKGVVAAGHPLTAEAGAQMLREGGNAFDAAICAALASFATESTLTGLGAGGFLLGHTAAGEDHLLDFFVEAGGRNLDADQRAEMVAAEVRFDQTLQVFNIGPASCGVPGTAAGLWQAAERFGTVPFERLIEPAVRLAREGVPVSAATAYLFTILEPIVTVYEETRALYAPDGRLLREGDLFRFPDLAEALERLAAEGPDSIYRSDLTERVCGWVNDRGGLLSTEDFAAYTPIERQPVRASYRGREVLTNSPPSSGGILIALALDLLGRSAPADLADPNTLALLLEAMEECNLARGPEFGAGLEREDFPIEFLAESRLKQAEARVRQRLAQPRGAAGGEGDALGSTTHISVLDADGNAASLTCSNGSCSGVMPPGTAIHLNNMLGEQDLNPLGFHQHGPGTRVTSMMAPTIVLRDGRVELSLGSAGSNRLRSAILQVIAFVVGYGMEVGEAVRHGRLHYEAGVAHAEPGFAGSALDELERRGYELVRWKRVNLFFGGAQAVHLDSSGAISGAGDPRRGGAAVLVD